MIPRTLSDLVVEMGKPIGHQKADAILVEALRGLVYRRSLNPQQRDAITQILDLYYVKLTHDGQMQLFPEMK